MTPNSEQTAEHEKLYAEWRDMAASFSERVTAASSPFPSPSYLKWLEKNVISFRLINQRLEAEVKEFRQQLEDKDMLAMGFKIGLEHEQQVTIPVLEERIKELEAEVERLKKEVIEWRDEARDNLRGGMSTLDEDGVQQTL